MTTGQSGFIEERDYRVMQEAIDALSVKPIGKGVWLVTFGEGV